MVTVGFVRVLLNAKIGLCRELVAQVGLPRATRVRVCDRRQIIVSHLNGYVSWFLDPPIYHTSSLPTILRPSRVAQPMQMVR